MEAHCIVNVLKPVTMNKKLRFGLSQVGEYAPKWLINTTSVMAILMTAKNYLVGGLPGVSQDVKIYIGLWFDYGLNIVQFLLAIAVIFVGQQKQVES